MTVVVTGASGFIGRRIVKALTSAGYDVVAVSRENVGYDRLVQWLKSPDLDSGSEWGPIIGHAHTVVHAAARVHIMNEWAADPLTEFRRINVDGTVKLARQAAAAGVRRFIFLSSVKVFGETTTGRAPFGPSDCANPQDAYATSKWEAEQALAQIGIATKMETVSIRPVLVYGAGVKGNMATLARVAIGRLPLPLGATNNDRSLLHVDNLANMIACVVGSQQVLPQVLLVRDDESPSTATLLRLIAKLAGRKLWLPAMPLWVLITIARILRRSAWMDRLIGSLEVDDTETRAKLCWTPPVTLEEGLKDMLSKLH